MKKSALLIPLALAGSLAVSLPAFANKGAVYSAPHEEMSRYHNGFYIGGSVGGNEYIGDFDQDLFLEFGGTTGFSAGGPRFLDIPDADSQSQNTGIGGQIQLGYGFFWETFFIAAEVSLNAASGNNDLGEDSALDFADESSLGEGFTVTLASDVDVELNTLEPVIDIKPGFKVGVNTLLYARVGAAFNEITLTDNLRFTEVDPFGFFVPAGTTITQNLEVSDSESVVGLRLGAGMEHRFSNNFAVNVDYIYTTYGSVDVSGVADIPVFDNDNDDFITNGLEVSDSVKVTRDMVMIGLNYYF